MRHAPSNVRYHELIGLRVEVLEHLNPSYTSIRGLVVDETKNVLAVKDASGTEKKIIKKGGVFLFVLPSGAKVVVRGDELIGRPEERVKRLRRRGR